MLHVRSGGRSGVVQRARARVAATQQCSNLAPARALSCDFAAQMNTHARAHMSLLHNARTRRARPSRVRVCDHVFVRARTPNTPLMCALLMTLADMIIYSQLMLIRLKPYMRQARCVLACVIAFSVPAPHPPTTHPHTHTHRRYLHCWCAT